MKFGVREICDVTLRAKANIKIGNKVFYKNEPVLFFDTLKTSTLEGASTVVYATGGKGNARLVAWEGERTVTFTMEDALISPESFMVLTGAGLIEPTEGKPIYQHMTENTDDFEVQENGDVYVWVKEKPYMPSDNKDNYAYIMAFNKEGAAFTEPFIPTHYSADELAAMEPDAEHGDGKKYRMVITSDGHEDYVDNDGDYIPSAISQFADCRHIIVDYYTAKSSNISQIEITADKFGGNYYLEASTLFRDQNGVDLPAEFVIPNCKIQSNFNFSMAATGDPSTFTFTMDAFPDYTRYDYSKKVLCAIQIITPEAETFTNHREFTPHAE